MSDEKLIKQICEHFNGADAKFENGKLWLKDFPIAEWRETEFTERLKLALTKLPDVANDSKPEEIAETLHEAIIEIRNLTLRVEALERNEGVMECQCGICDGTGVTPTEDTCTDCNGKGFIYLQVEAEPL